MMALGDVLLLNMGSLLATLSWKGPFFLYPIALPLALLALFFLPSRTAKEPKPLRIRRRQKAPKQQIFGVYLLCFMLSALCYVIPTQLPFLMQDHLTIDPKTSGLLLSMTNITGFLSCLAFTRCKPSVTRLNILTVSLFCIGAGFVAIHHATGPTLIMLGLPLAGIGIGLIRPNAMLWIMDLSACHEKGRLIGGLTAAFYLGEFFSPILLQPAASWLGPQGVFGFIAILLLAMSFLLFCLTHKPATATARTLTDLELRVAIASGGLRGSE